MYLHSIVMQENALCKNTNNNYYINNSFYRFYIPPDSTNNLLLVSITNYDIICTYKTYNSLLMSFHKRFSHNATFDDLTQKIPSIPDLISM